jgi:hypothetical protein
MNLKHVDIGAALRRLADQRIEDAMKEGKFDNLPGAGKEIELEPIPAEENARLNWWALRILRQNGVVPDEVALRKQIENLKVELDELTDGRRLPLYVARINAMVMRLNTLGTNALTNAPAPVDLAIERQRLGERMGNARSAH